ncbi:hypothetical protein [Streptomyces zingiberis]|uniref:Uncharacterized protein n=1 Tax=Streptomyces zingiberis TaxID=2053010 RepID=A0ABX1BVK6_9ACTN|nr:hypothetical protein [Streptomyces zingiberis]NJQ01725.1 hypothetical protein [Streptomyces zingiberis]
MTDLSELLGTLLASVSKARQMADVQTAVIAQQYRENALLEGLSVPRVRLPELRIDLPVLIEGVAEGSPVRFRDPKAIVHEVVTAVSETLGVWKMELPPDVRKKLTDRLRANLRHTLGKPGETLHREDIVRQAEKTSRAVLDRSALSGKLDTDQLHAIMDEVRHRVNQCSEEDAGQAPLVRVNPISGDVKERVSPGVVARLSLAIKEEGLEWEITRSGDGTTRSRLGPE